MWQPQSVCYRKSRGIFELHGVVLFTTASRALWRQHVRGFVKQRKARLSGREPFTPHHVDVHEAFPRDFFFPCSIVVWHFTAGSHCSNSTNKGGKGYIHGWRVVRGGAWGGIGREVIAGRTPHQLLSHAFLRISQPVTSVTIYQSLAVAGFFFSFFFFFFPYPLLLLPRLLQRRIDQRAQHLRRTLQPSLLLLFPFPISLFAHTKSAVWA